MIVYNKRLIPITLGPSKLFLGLWVLLASVSVGVLKEPNIRRFLWELLLTSSIALKNAF